MRISDWSSDVCSSDLRHNGTGQSRRMLLKAGAGAAALASMPALALARTSSATHSHPAQENQTMGTITTTDDTTIFYKDWGPKSAQPVVFHHGWPLSADDWDAQMLFFLGQGYRVIAHDRRGHGRSTQTDTGNDMDTYAADMIALAKALDLKQDRKSTRLNSSH